jgi:hypothetical protein
MSSDSLRKGVRVTGVFHMGASGSRHPLSNGQEVLFAQLQEGLVIDCDRELASNHVNPGTCQVLLEVPFPMGRNAMEFWGQEILGYQPLILDARVQVEANRIRWLPSASGLVLLENRLSDRMRDFAWEQAGTLAIPPSSDDATARFDALREAQVRLNRKTTEENLQYLCVELPWGRVGTSGFVFNWRTPGDCLAIVCMHNGVETRAVAIQIEDGVFKTFHSAAIAGDSERSLQIAMKQTANGILCNIRGDCFRLPVNFMAGTDVGVLGDLRPKSMLAVYPQSVENLLCLPAGMLEGHYQDRRVLAWLRVKCGLLEDCHGGSRTGRCSPHDFELYFHLAGSKPPRHAVPQQDPYSSTDGHPSIGGHLLFIH